MKALVVVAKRPEPGKTKTRLTPPLTPEQAVQLYEAFLRDTLALIQHETLRDVHPFIAYLPQGEEAYFHKLAPGVGLLPQIGDDLSERLDNALTHCLNSGFRQAVIMDSDSPTLPVDLMAQAFTALERSDVVIGPCDDGGYYLIGIKRPAPCLFRQVKMSTASVMQDTLARAAEEQLTVAQLPAWYDVDTYAEFQRLQRELAFISAERASHTRAAVARTGTIRDSAARSTPWPCPSRTD
jgi:rSAM/selenodomain-associated transferase 1